MLKTVYYISAQLIEFVMLLMNLRGRQNVTDRVILSVDLQSFEREMKVTGCGKRLRAI